MPTELPPNERAVRAPGSLELDPTADGITTDETRRLISSSKVEGTAVFDRAGEQIGTISSFMVDKVSGQVAYALMSFGGFLGLGENHLPLPWRALTYDVQLGGYVVDVDRDKLAEAPRLLPNGDPLVDAVDTYPPDGTDVVSQRSASPGGRPSRHGALERLPELILGRVAVRLERR